MDRLFKHGKKVVTAIAGAIVVLVGVILIPYPGPGWLVVFAGFAILSTEFTFAAKALTWLKSKYDTWVQWLKRQPKFVQSLTVVFTGLVIVVTIWLLNTFGLIDRLFGLNQPWLYSPLFGK